MRGAKNAFRSGLRTVSVTAILGLSIGLAMVMLLSYQAVEQRIASVKAGVGTTITVNPAGASDFQGGGEPLTNEQLEKIKELASVAKVSATLQDRLTAGDENNLQAAQEAGTLGNRNGRQAQRQTEQGIAASGGGVPERRVDTFTPPIMVTATTDPGSLISSSFSLISGEVFASDSQENEALVGTSLATKNNLSVGSSFTAYNAEIKVVGIYDAGNQFANAGLYLPLSTLQRLSGQENQFSSFAVTASSVEHVEEVSSAIRDDLGAETVDVTDTLEAAETALQPLENIKSIALFSLVGALAAGSTIILLIMMMTVRERRREIGVLKAIGASNMSIVIQFISESLVFTLLASVLGIMGGIALSNPVLEALVRGGTTTDSASTTVPSMGAMAGGGRMLFQLGGQVGGEFRNVLKGLQTTIGLDVVAYGLLAALCIAALGSALPAWLIAKVKPAEVMRAE